MMRLPQVRLAPPSWLRLPRRTARIRLTALCGALFLLSGVGLVAATYVLFERATDYKTPQLPKVPRALSIQNLQLSPKGSSVVHTLVSSGLSHAQQELGQAQHELAGAKPSSVVIGSDRLALLQNQLTQAQHQLAQGQHQLTQGRQQLAQALHQLAEVGPAQAAQRAADSHQLLVNSGIALAIVAVLALLAGWLVAGRMLRPIRTITRTARRISSTSLHERLALNGPEDEFKELGDTLDDLFGRLDAAFDAQRHFVANASHELRTPLTRERTLVQVALGDPSTPEVWKTTAEELLASNREQETLIEALLTLASGEGGLDHREPVDLSVIAQTVLHDRRDNGPLGLCIDAAIEPAPVDGDPRLVESLVTNLVDNAIRHNIEGGRVQIFVGRKDGEAVITVTNTGPSIEPADIQRLFQPFQRLDPRRSHRRDGHGLGLSIVRAIATAHRASVDAIPEAEGGLSISVTFPAPDDSPGPPSASDGLISSHSPTEMSAVTLG
jgi:signal transduction histidine kinase